MAVDTISNIITYGEISEYLAANDASSQLLFRGNTLVQKLSRLIYIVRKQVQNLYNVDPTNNTLNETANYLYALCGKYVNQAKLIIGSGGSGSIINPATGVISTIVSQTLEFKIGDVGSLMNAGDISLVLNYTSILNSSVSVVVDGVPLPITQSDRLSFTPIYSTPSVTLNFNQGALDTQVYVIMFLQYISI